MTLIGVTGAICSGKTTVAGFFGKLGAYVLDADSLVRGLYRKNKKIKKAILKKFGKSPFTRGAIDRRKLGRIVFNDKRKLKALSRLVHPEVIRIIKVKSRASKKEVVVIDAPLLVEAGLQNFVDYVIVVRTGLKKRLRRYGAMGFKKNRLRKIAAMQMPVRKKLQYADFTISNNRSKKYTRKEVEKTWKKINERMTYGAKRRKS